MKSTYRHKSTGKDVEIEIDNMDTEFITCRRPNRMMERIPRAEFDSMYELRLPPANPATIPAVPVVDDGGTPNPLGPAIPSTVAPEADPAFKLLRALQEDIHAHEDLLNLIARKVDAIHKIVVAPAPAAPPDATKPSS